MTYARNGSETTAQWLERLIGLGAPIDIRSNVEKILASEQGNYYFWCLVKYAVYLYWYGICS
jgi:hypothetical protein